MHENVSIEKYGRGNGRVFVTEANLPLDVLDPQEVVRELATAGFLLFRGFDTGVTPFNDFVSRLSSLVISDPAREFEGHAAQMVDAGTAAVGLHLENGNSPFMPDLTWFYCQLAAEQGSQTTVCDGYEVWDRLSEDAKLAFAAQDIVYSRTVLEQAWRTMAHHLLGGTKSYDEVTLDDMQGFLQNAEATTVTANDDGSVHYAHRTQAARRPTRFGSRPAWANSIFGPSFNYEKPVITFADGSEIGADLLAEAELVTDEVTENLEWQHGDVALIDNTRVMHGRREIVDANRKIFNAQSYVDQKYIDGI